MSESYTKGMDGGILRELMMNKTCKRTNERRKQKQIQVNPVESSDDSMNVVWAFDNIDRSGKFAFDIDRKEFDCYKIFEKILEYNTMTWHQVKMQTHDKSNKTKNHGLDINGISKEGLQRIKVKVLEEDSDSIFSFALMNKVRIIGIKKREIFHAIWFDPEHEFYPIGK